MGGHPERQVGSGRNAAKSVASSVPAVGFDHRQHAVAVGGGPAVPGNMLEHRQHAASHQPVRDRARDRRDLVGGIAISTVANHWVGARDRHIGDRQTIDIDADAARSAAISRAPRSRGREPGCGVPIVDAAVGGARRIGRPMRRAQALHAAALLIDQHRCIASHGLAKMTHQAAHLRRSLDVALEEDQPPGRALAQECPLRGRQSPCPQVR